MNYVINRKQKENFKGYFNLDDKIINTDPYPLSYQFKHTEKIFFYYFTLPKV